MVPRLVTPSSGLVDRILADSTGGKAVKRQANKRTVRRAGPPSLATRGLPIKPPIPIGDFPMQAEFPFTSYETFIYRNGFDSGRFVGWVRLLNRTEDVGYVYIRRPLEPPFLGSGYVVMDLLPEMLQPLLTVLQSEKPLAIGFYQGAEDVDPEAYIARPLLADEGKATTRALRRT